MKYTKKDWKPFNFLLHIFTQWHVKLFLLPCKRLINLLGVESILLEITFQYRLILLHTLLKRWYFLWSMSGLKRNFIKYRLQNKWRESIKLFFTYHLKCSSIRNKLDLKENFLCSCIQYFTLKEFKIRKIC